MTNSSSVTSSLRDNRTRGKVGEFLLSSIDPGSKLSFVSAFFTIYAYQQLKDRLEKVEQLRFLFGEPRFLSSIDPDKTEKRQYEIEDNNLVIPIANRLTQKRIAKECAAWISGKALIKSMVKPNFLHGKMYHVTQSNGVEKAIMGSSNFTVNGLGLGNKPNIELNLVVTDDRDRKELLEWFDEIWNDNTGLVEDVKDQVLKYLAQLYAENSPEFVYYKTLYHIFEKFLDEQVDTGMLTGKAGFFESEIWNILYDFQKDGVKGAINKLEKHNGCIIADSVGLGKTYEALAIINYYERLNYRVLLICPKKLKDNWTIFQSHKNHTLNPFRKDRYSYTVIYHTDLGRKTGISDADGINLQNFNWSAYDLIVIDESHNLRGNPKERLYEDEVTYNRAKFLLEVIIKSGCKSKVLMLSATPVNTTLKDLRNQIHYITEGEDTALVSNTGIENISNTLRVAQRQFSDWVNKHKNKERNANDLFTSLDGGFFKILDELTIARSRKHIASFYSDITIRSFPKRMPPVSKYAEIDLKGHFLSYDKINEEIMGYSLSLYNPAAYLKGEYICKYDEKREKEQFTQRDREFRLIEMMKIGFMKRLESSIHSFELTMKRTLDRIDDLLSKIDQYNLQMITSDEIEIFPYEFNDPDKDDEVELLEEDYTVGKKLKYHLAHLKLDEWLSALQRDKDQILALYNAACQVTPFNDAKLAQLKKLIKHKIENPINCDNRKILIFTAFADTAEYLYANLKDWMKDSFAMDSAIVSGSRLNKTTLKMPMRLQNDFNAILTCFAPKAKSRHLCTILPQDKEIDLLIGTDCISEGQNLQDCDFVVNYDIHWNPVRIIQRFGRIDRLNSPNSQIQMVNFWPTPNLDKYIQLKYRVEARMALVDVTATGEENPFTPEQIEIIISDEVKFRSKQLKRLQTEVIDLEEMDDGISITDFTLDDFRIDLMNYIKKNQKALMEAPLGIYGIVPSPNNAYWQPVLNVSSVQKDIIQPGVIFCLRHIPDGNEYQKINPLHPYFLVYVRSDNAVRYHYTNAKQILEIYRLLCYDRKSALDTLCDIFAQQTDDGTYMQDYDRLLRSALNDIRNTIDRTGTRILQNHRNAIIPVRQDDSVIEFELISWLIIL